MVVAPLVLAGVVACGEEGQTIGANQCPVLPIYQWTYFDAGQRWVRLDPEGNPVTKPNLADPDNDPAFKDLASNGRCQTPPGYSTSFGQGTGGQKGTGGAKPTDAGRD
jgi:hypothetical protein